MMQSENVVPFVWPVISNTASIVALVLAVVIFIFGLFSGARANKIRMFFAICLSAAIGWFTMPLAVKAALALHMLNTKTGVMILITIMMVFIAALATSIYEVITVTLSDIGMASKK
jgi:glucose-6-phosphate-specific signal transduction histidine kinase